ncbi:MAG: hypothetical protein LBT21_02265 [Oscillospiraceae bacterium]|jgi:hypothetical protein|nr:hypothetical protein [Oscillospiraceae bacterium]
MSPKILRPFVDQYPWLCVAGMIFLMVLILSIPYYTKELRERIHVGTKILFMIERNVKEIHDTGITTTYYINGFSQGTYKNYRTDWRTDRESVLTTVTSLKKRGLTIEYASGTQVFIKYKEICGGFGVALKGLEGIAKEMNIIE